jgi:hypothetical protein
VKYSNDAFVAGQQRIPCSARRTSGQLVVYFFANPEVAVKHAMLDLIEPNSCLLSKRVTLGGSLACNVNDYNNDNRRNVNANDNWSKASKMTLACNLRDLSLFLPMFLM